MNNDLENGNYVELNPKIKLDREFFRAAEHGDLEMNSFELFLYSLRSHLKSHIQEG